MRKWRQLLAPCLVLFVGCVSSPDALRSKQAQELSFDFPSIKSVETLKTFEDGSSVTALTLQLSGDELVCYGRFSKELTDELPGLARLSSIKLKRDEQGYLMVESISTDLGIYGFLRYWVAYSWLSHIMPYRGAAIVSLIVPILVFVGLLFCRVFFIEV